MNPKSSDVLTIASQKKKSGIITDEEYQEIKKKIKKIEVEDDIKGYKPPTSQKELREAQKKPMSRKDKKWIKNMEKELLENGLLSSRRTPEPKKWFSWFSSRDPDPDPDPDPWLF